MQILTINDAGGYDAQQNRSTVEPITLGGADGNMYTKEVEAFGRAVLGQGEIPVTAADAILSQKAIEDLYNL